MYFKLSNVNVMDIIKRKEFLCLSQDFKDSHLIPQRNQRINPSKFLTIIRRITSLDPF